MAQASATTAFQPPAIPWLSPQPLAADLDLGPGVDPGALRAALERLCADPCVQALVAFGSRGRGEGLQGSDLDLAVICREPSLDPALKTQRWSDLTRLLGLLDCDVDLVVPGAADAERLAGSRWHVMGAVARGGQVLSVAG